MDFNLPREVDEIGDISGRETPVPIPNTAVKPTRADGTNAQLGVGRVGRRRSHRLLGVLLGLFGQAVCAGNAQAQLLGTSARQMSPGSLKLLIFYRAVEDETLNFAVRSGGSCATAGGVSFPCNQTAKVSVLGSGRAAIAKLIYQPWDSFQYYAAMGIGDYDLKVPSTSVMNLLTGDKPGTLVTAGLKWVFYPDTVVTPALAVDASVTRSRYYLNKQFPSHVPATGNITQRLDLLESQVAVEASHLFTFVERFKFEPYGGVKWSYVWSDMKNLVDGSHAGGGTSVARPFIGMRVPVYDHEGFFAEAAFVDGTQYAAGLEVRF